MKIYRNLLITLFIFLSNTAAYATNNQYPIIIFKNIHNEATNFSADLRVQNSITPLPAGTIIYTNCPLSITNASPATLIHQQGDLYGFKLTTPLNSHETRTLHLTGQWNIKHITDAPHGYFIAPSITGKSTLPVNIPEENIKNKIPLNIQNDYDKNIEKKSAIIEGHVSQPVIQNNLNKIVPKPADITEDDQAPAFTLNDTTKILVTDDYEHTLAIAQQLKQALKIRTGLSLTIEKDKQNSTPNAITLFKKNLTISETTTEQNNEAYRININKNYGDNSITLEANTNHGLFNGAQSLVQLFSIDHKTVSAGSLTDYPRFSYRGILLDSVRHFTSVNQIKHLIDLMAMNKLNHLQWHLTDDEGWRLPPGALPSLTAQGAFRGFHLPLSPTLGSGALPYGGYYTEADIQEILAYAKAHYITIIPEIEMPGHARALTKLLPKTFVDPEDNSSYKGPQNYTDNVINPCLPAANLTLQRLIQHVSYLFPDAPYLSVGGDEVPTGAWMKSPACKKFMAEQSLTTQNALENYFFASMIQPILNATGKKLAGWGDLLNDIVNNNGTLPESQKLKNDGAMVVLWNVMQHDQTSQENYENKIIKGSKLGYNLVLAPAAYLYFDLAYSPDSREPAFYWAGTVDTFTAYQFTPITPNIAAQADLTKIKGVEGALWSENIDSNSDMEYLAFPKIAALAEIAWAPAEKRDWNDFAYRLSMNYLPLLEQLGVNYRISPPGIKIKNRRVYANTEFPTQKIYYDTLLKKHTRYDDKNPPIFTPDIKFYTCISSGRCSLPTFFQ